ncbi:Toll/interleukin-1 receptor domain-containing protein [Tanacetum coccineum]
MGCMHTRTRLIVEVNIVVNDYEIKKQREVEISLLPILEFVSPFIDCPFILPLLKGSSTELFLVVLGIKEKRKTVGAVKLLKLDINIMTPVIASSEFEGYIHILTDKGKIIYSYHVKDKTIFFSSIPCAGRTNHVSAWTMLKCTRLGVGRVHVYCKQKKGHNEDEIVVRSVKGNHVAESHLLHYRNGVLKRKESCVGVECHKLSPCRLESDKVDHDESHLLNLPPHVLEMLIMEFCTGIDYFRDVVPHCIRDRFIALNFLAACLYEVGHVQSSLFLIDDNKKIEQGERISNQLKKSIEDSKFYIIIFSKNYASSSWCLEELVKIMECQKMTEHTTFPVFYDVEPTQRDAMKELADLPDESKLIQLLVDVIFKKKFSTLLNADGKLVGMETRIKDILSSLEIGNEDVCIIGIKGMGSKGKTTLARAVYDQISNHFEGKIFVNNVREVSKPTLFGLKKLQKWILKDVFNKQDINFSSVHDGKNMLKDMMCRRKTLVVLDDVDCIEQLEAFAGESNCFKLGSRIIITTRDEQVLLAHGVNFIHDVNLLSWYPSFRLDPPTNFAILRSSVIFR